MPATTSVGTWEASRQYGVEAGVVVLNSRTPAKEYVLSSSPRPGIFIYLVVSAFNRCCTRLFIYVFAASGSYSSPDAPLLLVSFAAEWMPLVF